MRALPCWLRNVGNAVNERMPRMIAAISSSIKVNPWLGPPCMDAYFVAGRVGFGGEGIMSLVFIRGNVHEVGLDLY